MLIQVYTMRGCARSLSTKVWLDAHKYKYQEISLDNPAKLKNFRETNPTLKTLPQIFVDGKSIGGFSELLRSNL